MSDLHSKGTKNRVEGAIDTAKGKLRNAAGSLTGETDEQLRGKGEEMRGHLKTGLGKAQQDVADAVEKAKR
jgi:uncharacterized protein YjbJ (UPF0337 family)